MTSNLKTKILIIDDNRNIHDDFIKILANPEDSIGYENNAANLLKKYNILTTSSLTNLYSLDFAFQGEEAVEMVKTAKKRGQCYALAFVDMNMPPGWDGFTTVQNLWAVDPEIEIVICTAHSEYSWEETYEILKNKSNFLILKKPFDILEIKQLAASLIAKWNLKKQIQNQVIDLQNLTQKLEKSLSLMDATFESTADGILVFNKNNEIIKYNQLFLELWGFVENDIRDKSQNIIKKLTEKVKDPGSSNFLKKITSLNNCKSTFTHELILNDEKIIECYCRPQYLHNEIVGRVYSFRNITAQKNLEKRLMHQATHDLLTGLANRVLLIDRVKQAIMHAKRYNLYVGMFLFDIDNFKPINDLYGHDAGDIVLKWVAKKLKYFLREGDTVARLGGDEFVVLLEPLSQPETVVTLAKKLLELLSAQCPIENCDVNISVSVGVSIYPKDGDSYETLLKNADLAMYRAKENGGNTFEFYQQELNENKVILAKLKNDLAQALEKNQFIIHYQPLVDLASERIIGVEALIRWNHPDCGLISPVIFIPLAEEISQIVPIGEWVLKTSCRQYKKWEKAGYGPLQLAINVSVLQVRSNDYFTELKKTLNEIGFDPSHLELEIAESVWRSNNTEIIKKITELKTLGVHLSIDDFGTRYTGLNTLSLFPFNKLKIDKSFIESLSTLEKDNKIVEKIIQIAKKSGLKVSAKGVEKIEQVNYLKQHESDQVQGFFYSKPMSAQETTLLLKKQKENGRIFNQDLLP